MRNRKPDARTHSLSMTALRSAALATALCLAAASNAHEFSGPQGSVEVEWPNEQITRVRSSGYGDSFGMEAATLQGFPEAVTVGEHDCLIASYLLFDIDDEFAFDIDETVELELLIDRRNSSGLFIGYDRNRIAETVFEHRFEEDDAGLVSHRIELKRARFANRGEAHTDLMLAGISAAFPGVSDDDHRIVLCDLKVHRSNETPELAPGASFRLTVNDEKGAPTPARVGLYADDGRAPLPGDDALPIFRYDDVNRQLYLRSVRTAPPWPHENRQIFYVDGEYESVVPAGDYTLVIGKGPEYRVHQQTVTVSEGGTEVEVKLQRFGQMPRLGWFSGDDHVHMTRTAADNETIQKLMQAEDIHITNMLQMGNPASSHFMQYATGAEGRFFVGQHGLVSGIEDPRTALRGHTISLNIREVIRDPEIYLLHDRIFANYREQGAVTGYAHVTDDYFNVGRGLALDVPLGVVDFIEILQDGELGTAHWYDFLNLGYRIAPNAGSDYPYFHQPGAERVFVNVGTEFSIDAWFEYLREGVSFVTNGPLLDLQVNRMGPGSILEVEAGEEVSVVAGASLNPDFEPLDRIELVVHGEVVATADEIDAANSTVLSQRLTVDHGVWIALRAYGKEHSIAHSAPVYVVTDERGFRNDEKIPEIVPRMLARLDEFASLAVDPDIEVEGWEVAEAMEAMLASQQASIMETVETVRIIYEQLLEDVASHE